MPRKRTLIFTIMCLSLSVSVLLPHLLAADVTQLSLPEGAVKRLGKGSINEITYSPDGSLLAVAGSIGIWLYDAETSEELSLLRGHTYPVQSVSSVRMVRRWQMQVMTARKRCVCGTLPQEH